MLRDHPKIEGAAASLLSCEDNICAIADLGRTQPTILLVALVTVTGLGTLRAVVSFLNASRVGQNQLGPDVTAV